MLAALACSSDKVRTLIGCTDTATIRATLPSFVEPLSVEVCRKGQCSNATVGADECAAIAMNGVVCLSGGSAQLTATMNPEDPKDGDEYRVVATGADGMVVVDFSGTATYEESRPNGPDCEPLCRVYSANVE